MITKTLLIKLLDLTLITTKISQLEIPKAKSTLIDIKNYMRILIVTTLEWRQIQTILTEIAT